MGEENFENTLWTSNWAMRLENENSPGTDRILLVVDTKRKKIGVVEASDWNWSNKGR